MVLKTKNICLSDGSNITIKEISLLSRLKLQCVTVINAFDVYRESMSEQDFKKLENIIGNEYDIKLIITTVNELNEKKEEEVIDLKKKEI